MRVSRASVGLVATLILSGACGAAAGDGGGDTDLPTRGAGPFGKLEPDPATPVEEPVLLADPDGLEHWRAPVILAEGEGAYVVVFAAAGLGGTVIRRAEGVSLTHGPTDVRPLLEPEESWEATRMDHPSLVFPGAGESVGLFYEAGAGAIGYAESGDGLSFERFPANPVLVGDELEEGRRLGEPAAVWHQGDLWLYYSALDMGAIFVARFPGGDLANPERLDADARTPGRNPVLGPNPFAEQFDESGVGAPFVRITSKAGRPVFDLWYGGWGSDGRPTVGFAGSLDGLVFKRFDENPVLPAGGVTETDPAVITRDIGALMLFTQRPESGPEVIGAALH
ncbi:MAG: hypothetical protein RBU30_04470 [Polyangia bacterium]|nr:hypothetical protein [Polyangia bacterium]